MARCAADRPGTRNLGVSVGICTDGARFAAGGRGVAQPLSERDWAIAREIAPQLVTRGLLLVGLDVIGDHLTEINVTSPTCFQEITDQTGCDVSELFLQALELAASDASSVGQ